MESASRRRAAASLPDRIAFLGLGLIGGSIALAIREAGYSGTISAWTPAGRGPAEALRRGMVEEAAAHAQGALAGAGLVVLAGPPLAILESIGLLAGPWRSSLAVGSTITDVGSTKTRILEVAGRAFGTHFVGGHPMAGRELTGVEAASADLFVERPWVIVGGNAVEDAIAKVEALAHATGANTPRLEAREHDDIVAAISHVPLVVSAALAEAMAIAPGKAATWPMARLLAATGWRDATRLARGDPEMGAGILATNPAAVAERLRSVRTAIDAWIEDLEETPDSGRIRKRLEAVKTELEVVP